MDKLELERNSDEIVDELSKEILNVDNGKVFNIDKELFFKQKTDLQKEIDYMKNPSTKPTPDFLISSSKEKERISVMNKIRRLLKSRFSLITIADILQCNDYDRVDEIIENKENMNELIEKYSMKDGKKTIDFSSDFKGIVGDEYSKIYYQQEDRMRAAIKKISEGKYITSKKKNVIEDGLEDIIADVIDRPEFNLACQIEGEFINYELDRAVQILSEVEARSELQELIYDLNSLSMELEKRAHSYEVISKLVKKGKATKIIKNNDSEGR